VRRRLAPQSGIRSPLPANIALSVLDEHFTHKWEAWVCSPRPSARSFTASIRSPELQQPESDKSGGTSGWLNGKITGYSMSVIKFPHPGAALDHFVSSSRRSTRAILRRASAREGPGSVPRCSPVTNAWIAFS
jgi:hypothetical protein